MTLCRKRHKGLETLYIEKTLEAIRYLTEVLIGTGSGWFDAEPEIRRLKPSMKTATDPKNVCFAEKMESNTSS
jgi:uncharacterized protein (DUF362 family)